MGLRGNVELILQCNLGPLSVIGKAKLFKRHTNIVYSISVQLFMFSFYVIFLGSIKWATKPP